MITVRKLTRRFGPAVAIEDLNFDLEAGEVVGFLGPNGAGKTTAMRILTGFLPATSGSATIAGLDVLRDSLAVRQKIGYLPESVPLYREHRVSEMMHFQARLHGIPRKDAKTRIPEVLERVGIADRMRSLVGSLSRGQRQRVGLAVALLPNPEVLILDEPTSGLDPLQRLEVRKLLRELAREHTVLLSSHILPEIEAVCPRVIILNKGRIAADGTADELVRQLGSPSHVRLEAVVGDAAEAQRLLGTLSGVKAIADEGRLGIHHQFVIECDDDLREDIGALAAQCGWALRELSWHVPSLEDLFARIALELEGGAPREAPVSHEAPLSHASPGSPVQLAPAASEPSAPAPGMNVLSPFESAPAKPAPGSGEGGDGGKIVYNLNPFDQGASRDLGKPKAIEDPLAPPGNVPPPSADCEEAGS